MRLSYFHYLAPGASGLHHVSQFAAAARQMGHRVDIHAMNPSSSHNGEANDRSVVRKLRGVAKQALSRYLHEPKELIWNLRYLPKDISVLSESRPEAVIIRDSPLAASTIVVARRFGLPVTLELNAPALEMRDFSKQYLHLPMVAAMLEEWKLRHAEAAVVVSRSLRDYFVRRYGVPDDKFTIAPNGVDLELFEPGQTCAEHISTRVGEGPTVGFVGSFQNWHGIDHLARLAIDLSETQPETRFLFVGQGAELSKLLSVKEQLGDRVLMPGNVDHDKIPSYVACLDVAVLPNCLPYASPLKLLEWMAAGKAIVAPRYKAIEELVEDGVEALLFEPENYEGLLQASVRLLRDSAFRRAIGKAAAMRAARSFTWRHNAELVIEACERARRNKLAGRSG